MSGFTFEHICDIFSEKACKVLTEKKEYEENRGTTKTKLHVQMACGHNENISQNCFRKRVHHCCKQCMFEEMKKVSYDNVQQVATSSLLERQSFIYVEEVLKDVFLVSKTHEGCSADMIIKPKNATANEWIGIQLKAKNKTENNSYSFGKIGNYSDEIVLCISFPSKKMWVFKGLELQGKTGISIGVNRSKHSSHEVSKSDLTNYLHDSYMNQTKFTKETLNIPRTICSKIEHSNRLLREQIFQNTFDLQYPKIDGTKYDIIINGYKVQDKTSRGTSSPNCFYVKLYYKKGDNDFYWVFHENGFYILPEDIVLDSNDKIRPAMTLNKNVEMYYYELDDPLLLTKLQAVFKV